jgi:hypothetical protein
MWNRAQNIIEQSASDSLASVQNLQLVQTTKVGRLLLMVSIMLLPLQDHFPAIGSFGVMFFVFAVLASYAIINSPHTLDRVWLHPVFIAAYTFTVLGMLLEFASPESKYDDILRVGMMVGAAVCIASLCADRLALRACLYAYIGTALWLGIVLFLTSYGALQGVSTSNFTEASLARAQVMRQVPIGANANGMAFACLQGGVVAFAFALTESRLYRRNSFLAITIFCSVASCLAMSRGSIAIGIVSCSVVLYARGLTKSKSLISAAALGLFILFLVPNTVWTRFDTSALSAEGDVEQMESRVALYVLALRHLPEYVLTGVGAGNSMQALGEWSTWVHNSFLHVTIQLGLLGLFAFIIVIWRAYKCLPTGCGRDGLALALVGVALSLFLLLFFTHNYNEKHFSLGLGMLVASRCWIWPDGTIQLENSFSEQS